jgi:hypothetical protein
LIIRFIRATFGAGAYWYAAKKKGEVVARRIINFENLSDADKQELKQLLQRQKEALENALKATNKELSDLSRAKKAKKGRKAKKAKR